MRCSFAGFGQGKCFHYLRLVQMKYEIHITIAPLLTDSERERVSQAIRGTGFKLADLLMAKRPTDTPERSKFDTFITGHRDDLGDAYQMVKHVVGLIQKAGYNVWRYKVEEIILDSKHADTWGLFSNNPGYNSTTAKGVQP